MSTLFERYRALYIDGSCIDLEYSGRRYEPDWCYPKNAEPIGYENGIMYCFIKGYGETVFAANPESYNSDVHVYPLARSFEDFLGLILACGSANPPEQVIWMTRERFEEHVKNTLADTFSKNREAVLKRIREELGVEPISDPYDYVKSVQKDFDYSKIKFRKERNNKVQFEEVRMTVVTRFKNDK